MRLSEILTRRLSWVVLLLIISFILGLPIWQALLDTTPQEVRDTWGEATVWFSADDTTFVFSNDCVSVGWNVQGIRAVELNGIGVVGEGRQIDCADDLKLTVWFQNDSIKTYELVKDAVADTLVGRTLLVGLVLSLAAVVWVSGVLQVVGRWFATSRFGHALTWVFPQVRQDKLLPLRRLDLLIMTALILLGFAVRSTYLLIPVKHDEAWTFIEFASKPLSVALSTYNSTNNHLLYTLLMHLSVQIFGVQPWTIRLPAIVAGVLMIPMAFQAARRLYRDRTVAWLTAALVAGASHLIEFSVNGRGYTLVTLIFLALLVNASDLLRKPALIRWGLLAVLSALGLYTVPTMLYPLGVVWGWLVLSALLEKQGPARLRYLGGIALAVVVGAAITLLLYAPILITGSWQEGETTRILSTLNMTEFVDRLDIVIAETLPKWVRDLPDWFATLLSAGLIIGLVMSWRIARQRPLWLLSGLIWLPAVTFVQLVSTYPRLWIFIQPIFLMVAAAGFTYLVSILTTSRKRTHRVVMLFTSVVVCSSMSLSLMGTDAIYMADETGLHNEAEKIVMDLETLVGEEDYVLCAGACYPVFFYAEIHNYDVGSIANSIPGDIDHLFIVLTTHTLGQRNFADVLSFMPDVYKTYAYDVVATYAHAEIYRFDVPAQP